MRYENWDVLLFSAGSRVPIQEFRTQCFVTRDTESPYILNPDFVGPNAYVRSLGGNRQIPVLTSFIPSLPANTPFRISIHNWDKPKPSRFTESIMQPDDVLLYEARVFIDGECVAAGVFGQRGAWPYVIDLSSHIDRDGNQDFLRFPQFHSEILDQRHWDACDILGRIRIVLSEGFARPNRSPPFERVKDAIFFSFQHAPQQILEFSQIAWPNHHMWSQDAPRPLCNGTQHTLDPKEPEDAHAHSPGKPESRVFMTSVAPMATIGHFTIAQAPTVSNNAWVAGRAFPLPNSQWYAQSQARNSRWTGLQDRYQEAFTESAVDPFINDPTWRHRGARSSREDVPMPDYSTSSGSRVISSVTGMSYVHSKPSSMSVPMDEEQYNQLIEAMTPTKPPMGTRTPSNTPFAITVHATAKAITPTATRKASGQNPDTGRTLGLRERSQASSRDVSGSAIVLVEKDSSPTKIGASPSENVKSRKKRDQEKEKEKEKDKGAQKENESVGGSSTSTEL
ncbi:hypothetical protein F1880_001959 [Penicillium rolfsii]|nr:hypothetical protein F1880_001959 [Penicillium rolfsii]